jgi:hypothetical protein
MHASTKVGNWPLASTPRSSLHVRPSTATEAAGLHPVCGDASRSRDERNLSNITLHLTNEQLAHGEE